MILNWSVSLYENNSLLRFVNVTTGLNEDPYEKIKFTKEEKEKIDSGQIVLEAKLLKK